MDEVQCKLDMLLALHRQRPTTSSATVAQTSPARSESEAAAAAEQAASVDRQRSRSVSGGREADGARRRPTMAVAGRSATVHLLHTAAAPPCPAPAQPQVFDINDDDDDDRPADEHDDDAR